MTREEALKRFKQEQEPFLNQCRQNFIETFPEKVPTLMAQIKDAFASISSQAAEQGKENIVFFHFSLLRCDLPARKYNVLLMAQDIQWFLDPKPLETLLSADFLFAEYDHVWKRLLEEKGKYIGKVNSFDVGFIVQEEIAACNQIVGNALRYFFRDVEESPEFESIPKECLWDIRWGQYRDDSVLAARVDRIPKTAAQWNEALVKDQEHRLLSESYWYQADLEAGDCSGKELFFVTFENCHLRNLNFEKANLTGARFRNCVMEHCNFKSAMLNTAFFEECQWKGADFTDAIFQQTIFTEGAVPQYDFDEVQHAGILIKEGQCP